MTGPRVRILEPHDPGLDYHEWVHLSGPGHEHGIALDSLGRRNPRMCTGGWLRWRCNNPACPGEAAINETDLAALIDTAAEGRPVQGCMACATYRAEGRACPTHRAT